MEGMFYNVNLYGSIDISGLGTSMVNNMREMFENIYIGNSSTLDISNFNFSNVTDISYMFDMSNIDHFILPSTFNAPKVETMQGLFSYTTNISAVNSILSKLKVPNVKDISYLFRNTDVTNLVIPYNFDSSKVTTMTGMFYEAYMTDNSNFQTALSNIETNSVIDVSYMFSKFDSESALNLQNLNFAKVKDFSYMFSETTGFYGIYMTLPTEATGFNCNGMFYNSNLEQIYVFGDTDWRDNSATSSVNMFYGASLLIGIDKNGNETAYSSSKTDINYAFMGKGGYFSYQ